MDILSAIGIDINKNKFMTAEKFNDLIEFLRSDKIQEFLEKLWVFQSQRLMFNNGHFQMRFKELKKINFQYAVSSYE